MAAGEASGAGRKSTVLNLIGLAVVLVVAFVAYRLIAPDETVADLSDAEIEDVLLTSEEVAAVASEGRQADRGFEPRPFDEALAQMAVDTSAAAAQMDQVECDDYVDQVVPGASPATAAVAHQATGDGSFVLHTLSRRDDGDRSVAALHDAASLCNAAGLGAPDGRRLAAGMAGEIELGDAAFQQEMRVEVFADNELTDTIDRYLTIVVVERDGLIATVTMVKGDGSARVDEQELARELAEEADAKLRAQL